MTKEIRFSSPLAGAVRKKVDKELAYLRETVLRSAEDAPEPVKSEWPHLIQLCRTLGLFASVIKSGEPWTATCQTEYELANTAAKELYSELNALPAQETPPEVPGEVPTACVGEMKTSAGADYFVCVRVGDRELTPHMHKIRSRAEYEVAEWQWLFNGGEKPDILAYREVAAPLPASPEQGEKE